MLDYIFCSIFGIYSTLYTISEYEVRNSLSTSLASPYLHMSEIVAIDPFTDYSGVVSCISKILFPCGPCDMSSSSSHPKILFLHFFLISA